MFRVKLSTRAKKELKEISVRHRIAIAEIIEDLKEDPYLGKPLDREFTKRYSYRAGDHRIIYTINLIDKQILVITSGHRSTVYVPN